MDEWQVLPGAETIAPGTGCTLRVQGQDVAVFSVNGALMAMEDSCPHAGASLGRGRLQGCVVQCPAHGLKFDLRTGCMPGVPSFGVKIYPVKQEEGRFWIALTTNYNGDRTDP